MIKSDNYLKAIAVRDRLKTKINNIIYTQIELYPNNPEKRTFPVYFDRWKKLLFKLENLVIDYKYGLIK